MLKEFIKILLKSDNDALRESALFLIFKSSKQELVFSEKYSNKI